MNQKAAIEKQANIKSASKKDRGLKQFGRRLLGVAAAGCLLKLVLGVCLDEEIRSVYETFEKDYLGSRIVVTGPKAYMNYALLWPWLIKAYSLYQITSSGTEWPKYKTTVFRDTVATLLFYLEYYLVVFIYQHTDNFKISGHFLVLCFQSSILVSEERVSYHFYGNKVVQIACRVLLYTNLYILFWTSLVFHSLSEVALALVMGYASVYVLHFKVKF